MTTASSYPGTSRETLLQRASELWGVQDQYWDIFGKRHVTAPEVQQVILSAMGVTTRTEEELWNSIEERTWQQWSRLVAPTVVVATSERIPVHVPASYLSGELLLEFRFEDHGTDTVRCFLEDLPDALTTTVRGTSYFRKLCPLPDTAPLGYHTLRATATLDGFPDIVSEARLILCPERAYRPAFLDTGGKGAGIAVSLYGIRSGGNWGCGDFADLREFASWVAQDAGASFVALNPLHSIPNRQPYNTSPYLPNSTFYRNPIYLAVEQIDDIKRSPLVQKLLTGSHVRSLIAELQAAPYVEYERVCALKMRMLKGGFRQFLRDRQGKVEFDAYVEREGALLDRYAVYCALDEVLHKRDRNLWIWPDWPEQFRDPESAQIAEFRREHPKLILFYKYVQWHLDRQLAAAQAHALEQGLKVGLYHDLALATDRCGSDLWAHRPFYVAGCRVGSPPDDFSPDGQDWAFPPPNSLRHFEDGYRLFVESIRKNCAHGGALRIDHVMRFFRLFWIPDGDDAKSGVYVREFSDDLVRILALESVRNQVVIIGEDLGTVEPFIRETLQRFGILSYRLLYFEKNGDGSFRTPNEYPRESLVSVTTHDLPTLAGFWTGRDIVARRNAGILTDEASYEAQMRDRRLEKQKLLELFLRLHLLPSWHTRSVDEIPEFTGDLHNAAVGFLALTPAELLVLNQEDLFKDADQQNLPGTTAEYPNWRHKMRYRLEELRSNPEAAACTLMFRTWLQRTGRLN